MDYLKVNGIYLKTELVNHSAKFLNVIKFNRGKKRRIFNYIYRKSFKKSKKEGNQSKYNKFYRLIIKQNNNKNQIFNLLKIREFEREIISLSTKKK